MFHLTIGSEQDGKEIPDNDDADLEAEIEAAGEDADRTHTTDQNISTKRIAVQNCDWENIKSEDLM